MMITRIAFSLVALICHLLKFCASHSDHSSVLMISFDGFRWDYLKKVKEAGKSTPNFDMLMRDGVTIKSPGGMKSAFVTVTYPNHYTLVTGMYEESHGVVQNEMFDPVFNETFHNTPEQSADPKWWDNGLETGGPEPIWITNQRDTEHALFKKRSGVFFWPGSPAPNNGMHAHHYKMYDQTVPNKTRIDTVMDWFSTEDEPINLGLLYFEEPDNLGHLLGPNAPHILDTIVELDKLIGYLLQKLREHHLDKTINLVITSDHGMREVEHYISVDEYVNPDTYTHYGETPVWNIVPKEGIHNMHTQTFYILH